jgi:flagellar motor switch protein FliG
MKQPQTALTLPGTALPPGELHPKINATRSADLQRRAKAAIVVRLLLAEGADVRLDELPDNLQARLTQQMAGMGLIDRSTLNAVIQEFAEALDGVGLSFPRGMAETLEALDGRISAQTAARLRKEAGVRAAGDPWKRLRDLPVEDLATIAQVESTEVAAVLLSKLDVPKAAELLGLLPGSEARRITFAVSQTASITPDTVDRIGLSLAAQLDQKPDLAFDTGPSARVGAILNQSPATTRDDLLTGLDEQDAEFANSVRRAIFTFDHIPQRLQARDVPAVVRIVDDAELITALAFATAPDDAASVEFLLSNMSTRLADNLREEVAERGKVKTADGEAALTAVVAAIRTLETDGQIQLIDPDEGDD